MKLVHHTSVLLTETKYDLHAYIAVCYLSPKETASTVQIPSTFIYKYNELKLCQIFLFVFKVVITDYFKFYDKYS